MSGSASQTDAKINRSGRRECYTARDAFYQCVKECGYIYTPAAPVPAKCKQLRSAFEGACLPSWVAYFDELQEKEARLTKQTHRDIDRRAATSAGNLAGKA